MRTLIIAGGQLEDAFVREQAAKEPCCLIAADRGLECCDRLGLVPDYVIGDFDSLRSDICRRWGILPEKSAGAGSDGRECGVIRLHPEKDDTDTEAALRLALEKTRGDIVILGATGSRIDHVLANISVLGLCIAAHRRAELLDLHNRIRLMDRPFVLERESQYGRFVSLIPFTTQVTGITLEGFKYPLCNYTLGPFTSIGVSNEIVGDAGRVFFSEGILVLIESRDCPR